MMDFSAPASRRAALAVLAGFATAALTVAAATPVFAQDAALYDAPPPEDAAFIRWLDQSADTTQFGASFAEDVRAEPAFHPISTAGLNGADVGAHYSAVTGADGTTLLIPEAARDDRSKVHLTLVNASSAPVRLVLMGQDVEVVGALESGTSAMRKVNPIAVTLGVQSLSDDSILAEFELTLRRGQDISFIAAPSGAFMVEDSFGPTIAPN